MAPIKNNDKLQVFETGYHDRIILPEHNLDDVYKYINHNPYRLAVRRHRPDFFRKERNIFVDGREMQGYGNHFHLRNPFRHPLVVHRADNEAVFNAKMEEALYYAENGGVVVSPFISAREKIIRKKIEEAGGKIILINNRPFGDRAKPAKHEFDLCTEGKLLILSPIDYLNLPPTDHPTRQQCLDMNEISTQIAENKIQIKS